MEFLSFKIVEFLGNVTVFYLLSKEIRISSFPEAVISLNCLPLISYKKV